MVVSLLALLVALISHEARAGFIRPRATFPTPGIHAGLLGLPEISGDAALLAGMHPFDGAGPLRPADDEDNDSSPAFRTVQGSLVSSDGACGAESSSYPGGSSSNPAIHYLAVAIPECTLLSRLPDEMGPHFSNPPPWTLLRPPCRCDTGD